MKSANKTKTPRLRVGALGGSSRGGEALVRGGKAPTALQLGCFDLKPPATVEL